MRHPLKIAFHEREAKVKKKQQHKEEPAFAPMQLYYYLNPFHSVFLVFCAVFCLDANVVERRKN